MPVAESHEWTPERFGIVLRAVGVAEEAIDRGDLPNAYGPVALAVGAVEMLDPEPASLPWLAEAHDIERQMRAAAVTGAPPLDTVWLLQRASELLVTMRRRLDEVGDDRATIPAMEAMFPRRE